MIAALGRTIWILSILIGVSIGFACVLQWLGKKIRCRGVSGWSRTYWYFVSPGVACHELGHCVGCWITGNRVLRVVFFDPNNYKYLGCVRHSISGGWRGAIQSTIISTGPIWFGCLVIALLSKLLLGSAVMVRMDDYVLSPLAPGLFDYLVGCFQAGFGLFAGRMLDVLVSPIRAIIWLYLSFCIASEIGLSGLDMSHLWKGLIIVMGVLSALSLIPFVGKWIMAGVCAFLPVVFILHALMAMGIIVSLLMLLIVRSVR